MNFESVFCDFLCGALSTSCLNFFWWLKVKILMIIVKILVVDNTTQFIYQIEDVIYIVQ